MTRRSALLAGLAVMFVLLGGQVYISWLSRPVTARPTLSSAQAPASASRPRPPDGRAPEAAAPTSPPAATGTPAPQPTRPPDSKLAAMGVRLTTGKRGIALTFDDGPHPQFTPQLLALLRHHRLRAVFCVVGSEAKRYPHLVAQIAREGHTLCNHSWRHELDLGKRPAAEIRANLARTNAEIRRAVPAAKIPFFRQPGGRWTPSVVRTARDLGMTSLGWSVDPRDWESENARAIHHRVLAGARPGSVILLHDAGGDRAATVRACQTLVPTLKGRHEIISVF